jgi:hypothetical protein
MLNVMQKCRIIGASLPNLIRDGIGDPENAHERVELMR